MKDLLAKKTNISFEGDSYTLINAGKDGYAVQWAGCVYGPDKDLKAIVSNPFALYCEDVLQSPETVWESSEWIYCEDIGYLELSENA